MKRKTVFIPKFGVILSRLTPCVIAGLIFCLTGCTTYHRVQRFETVPSIIEEKPAVAVSYSPKAHIRVADFEMKTMKVTSEVSSALRQMLVAALLKSNKFEVVDLQVLKQVEQNHDSNKENVLIGPELPKEEQPAGNPADLIITVVITEFEPHTSGGSAGVGGGGGVRSGYLGGLLGAALNKAHISLDVRIVKASNSEVLFSKLIQGQASDIRGAVMSGDEEKVELSGKLSGYTDTPMEKAIRLSIDEAVRYITDTIPSSYYK